YDSARVAIAPILYGAGTKIKTIEALQHGVPVVATPVGAEGLGDVDGKGVSISDNPQSFAEKLLRLLEDATLWDQQRVAASDSCHDRSKRLGARLFARLRLHRR
ncbi:MAG: glycosyltransferase family 4 protein, partial [Candidatus Eremiobacteraeota bacterium]|nr:glycosyltransferase family 4 protein [Candidatus Eremiobacteraeota bacterium]